MRLSNYQKNNKAVILGKTKPEEGTYGVLMEGHLETGNWFLREWMFCRDHLQRHKINRFIYATSDHKPVAAFIQKIEDQLKLGERTQFGPTQVDLAMWIKPAKFWLEYAMRRSLFTALIRAGNNYNRKEDNFEEALWSEDYLKDTKYAVQRFLNGYTRYTGKKSGWHNQFYANGTFEWDVTAPPPPTLAKINELLVRPK
jgi:hypothetical protein